jgi:hypothetical protein
MTRRTFPANLSQAIAALALTGLCFACAQKDQRKPVFPVRGKVLYNGKPAAGAFVVFHPLSPSGADVPRPRAHAAEDGTYHLTTHLTNDGAPAGEYAVTVTWPGPPPKGADREDEGPDRLQGRYANPKTSGLRADVKDGGNEIPPFTLK